MSQAYTWMMSISTWMGLSFCVFLMVIGRFVIPRIRQGLNSVVTQIRDHLQKERQNLHTAETDTLLAEEHYQTAQQKAQDMTLHGRQRIQNLRLRHQHEHENLVKSLTAAAEQVRAFQEQEHTKSLIHGAFVQAVNEVNQEFQNNPKEQMIFMDDLLYKMHKIQ